MRIAIIEGTAAEIHEALKDAGQTDLDLIFTGPIPQPLSTPKETPEPVRELPNFLPERIPAADIIRAVTEVTGRSSPDLCGQARNRHLSYARHLAMYLLHHDGRLSIAEIQRLFDDRNHSTIIGALTRIEMELKTRPETQQDLEACRRALCTSTA